MTDSNVPSPATSPDADFDPGARGLEDGIALCLSGGGYRAMVFHAGVLLRLNEAGILQNLKRISSVSGGSITSAVLGMNWNRLKDAGFTPSAFNNLLIEPIRKMARKTIDAGSILGGIGWFGTISDWVADAYDKTLFDGSTLQDLPTDDEGPRFIFNATNVQSGALWRFSKPYMADYLVGMIHNPRVPLAQAVAASSAFPPVLSPAKLDVNPASFVADPNCPLQHPPYTDEVVLSDGGVYDNLGLETAWKRYKTILVSDAGGQMQPEPDPETDWARHSIRINSIIDNQVRSLRKRMLIDAYQDAHDPHQGAYWGIRSDIANYGPGPNLPCPHRQTIVLADTPTRLKKLPITRINRLMNWGYAICDASVRKWHDTSLPLPNSFPFDDGIG